MHFENLAGLWSILVKMHQLSNALDTFYSGSILISTNWPYKKLYMKMSQYKEAATTHEIHGCHCLLEMTRMMIAWNGHFE